MSSIEGYVQLQRRIKIDADFTELSPMGQWLYYTLLVDVNHIGVAAWAPKKLALRSKSATVATVNIAAQELIDTRFAVLDLDADEIMLRTYIKHDEAHKQPNTCKSMLTAFGRVASPWIKHVVSQQLSEIWKSIDWKHKTGRIDDAEMKRIQKRWGTLDLILEYPPMTADEVAEQNPIDLLGGADLSYVGTY